MIDNIWFASPKKNINKKINLFCFPYAGGGISVFKQWEGLLNADAQMFIAQLPGRGRRIQDLPISDMDQLISQLAHAIKLLLDGPAVFFGYSNGALIAFELAKRLRNEGFTNIKHIILAAKRAPNLLKIAENTFDLPKKDLIETIRRYNGTPLELIENEELLDLLLPALRSDFALSDQYKYKYDSPLDCNLTLMGSETDPYVPYGDLLRWKEHFLGQHEAISYEGDHFFLNTNMINMIDTINLTLKKYIVSY